MTDRRGYRPFVLSLQILAAVSTSARMITAYDGKPNPEILLWALLAWACIAGALTEVRR